jgi:hypothetical protein
LEQQIASDATMVKERDSAITGLRKKLTETQSAHKKLHRDFTSVSHQLHHAQVDKPKHEQLCQRNSELLACNRTLEQKLSKYGKLAQQQKETTNEESESLWEMIEAL